MARWRSLYGAHPAHLVVLIAAFALTGYAVAVLGLDALWNSTVWWQSILTWFAAAVIVHDLVLFPLYALTDRALTAALSAMHRPTALGKPKNMPRRQVSPLNYLRVPALASGLLFLMFLPGIIEQGSSTYLAATGQTQQPFLNRWLLITAVLFIVTSLVYAVRRMHAHQHGTVSGEIE